MSHTQSIITVPLEQRFIPMPRRRGEVPDWDALGLPQHVKARKDAELGLLKLVTGPSGRTGVFGADALEYRAAISRPYGKSARNMQKATTASVRSRAGRAA